MEIRTAAPRIPDHDVLRCIGKGSYGEVWLARAVTGTLRAVKVVRREDFELDRTFEREFEGIMKFEPISREHPGLVHVLHVGRNDEQKFYYYVMELGDDRERGSRVDASDYEARTMGTDRSIKHRLPIAECIEHGAQVAEGLAHLHECGLTHRDIKPSNIIFVNGKAKLADIGLVAAAGQMTFVGTEGFVPPEGPGTTLADIYSLGMVLYELSTGKDRLQFPELPDDLGDARTRPQWQALNEIILKACAVQPKKRFSTSRDMALALRAAGRRKPKGAPWGRRLIFLPFLTAAAGFAIVTWMHNGAMPWPPGRFASKDGSPKPLPARNGRVKLQSDPSGAEVIYNGNLLGRTPLVVSVPAGDAVFTLKRKRYRDTVITVSGILADTEKQIEPEILRFEPPRPGQVWENSLGMLFDPQGNDHLSRRAVSYDQLTKIQEGSEGGVVIEKLGGGVEIPMAGIQPGDAIRFCDALTQREVFDGWLQPDQCYRPEPYTPKDPNEAKKLKNGATCFRLAIEKYGAVHLESDPPGAEIHENGVRLGNTPWDSFQHRTGALTFRLSLPGYEDLTLNGVLPSGGFLAPKIAKLQPSKLAVFGKPWKNHQQLPFVPLSPDLLAATFETRLKDFQEYITATGTEWRGPGTDAEVSPLHPVTNVTREEARLYCQWLTETERKSKFIDDSMAYRLPTDVEWSLAAGSPNLNESRRTPSERHLTFTGVYPWVPPYQFPPPAASATAKAAGNLGDLTALKRNALGALKPWQIKALETQGYDDGAAFTSPVGQYAPNGIGLFDLSGNVWEFVDDDYGAERPPERQAYAVVRGGAWNTLAIERDELATQFRNAIPPDKADNIYGFRIVLASLIPTAPAVPVSPTAPAGTTNPSPMPVPPNGTPNSNGTLNGVPNGTPNAILPQAPSGQTPGQLPSGQQPMPMPIPTPMPNQGQSSPTPSYQPGAPSYQPAVPNPFPPATPGSPQNPFPPITSPEPDNLPN